MKDCLDLNKSQTSRRWSRYLEDGKLSIRVAPEKKRELQRRLRKLGGGYSLTDLILFGLSLEDAYLKKKSLRQLAADIDEMKTKEGRGPLERDTIRDFLQRVNITQPLGIDGDGRCGAAPSPDVDEGRDA